MRIAVSGTACQGKTTFIKDFTKEWPKYKTIDSNYRKEIKNKKLKHSKQTNEDVQWMILNSMIDDMQKNCDRDNKVIFDRCPLDNIVYSIWANAKDSKNISDEFIEKCIPLVRESMRMLDIVFFIPVTRVAPVEVKEESHREADKEYIKEIDNIFKSIVYQIHKTGVSVFFPKDDSPGIIEIFGKPEERIQLARYYLNAEGEMIGDEQSVISDLNLTSQVEDLLKAQKDIAQSENFEKKIYNNLIIPDR